MRSALFHGVYVVRPAPQGKAKICEVIVAAPQCLYASRTRAAMVCRKTVTTRHPHCRARPQPVPFSPMKLLRPIGAMLYNYKRLPYAEIRAFSVHILTASGAYLAFLALVAAAEQRFVDMWWWLGLALLVDGIDGPIARKLKVKEVLPTWSGELLDNVIDYVTYVLIPAFALYQSGMIGPTMSFVCAGLIVISSAIYYANMGMKTAENFFSGFPVVWNMLVFTLFAINAGEWTAMIVVFIAVFVTFLPIHFLHPVRVVRLRRVNLAIFLAWCFFSGWSLILHFDSPVWLVLAISLTGLYLAVIGGVMQLFPRLGVRPA
jgi:phosphatidylcholine synthase